MEKIHALIVVLCCFAGGIQAQTEEKNTEEKEENSFHVGLEMGSHTQRIEIENQHLANLTSYNIGFFASYEFSDYIGLKTGIQGFSKVSTYSFSYSSYSIPLYFEFNSSQGIHDLFNVESSSEFDLIVELGAYYKGIYDFEDTSVNIPPTPPFYDTNNIFGLHAGFSFRYHLSKIMFTSLNFNINHDADEIIKRSGVNFKVENSYGFRLGFGFKL